MFGRNIDLTFATFLLTLSLPLLLIHALRVPGKSWPHGAAPSRRALTNVISNKNFENHSDMDQAIAAYEELIDAAVSGKAQ